MVSLILVVRIGVGYDIHRLVGGRPFPLGGVLIDYPQGPLGHSDGDVLLHAIIDALLGAAGLGDVGSHFPPEAPRWQGIASTELLTQTLSLVVKAGFSPHNVDATVVLERPAIGPALPQMRQTIAHTLGIAAERVNVKAKTNEGVDTLGHGKAVAAYAVALLEETR